MKSIRMLSSTLSAALVLFCLTSGTGFAAEPANHIVTGTEIQAQMDTQLHSEAADRQEIRDLMGRPEFQRIAGTAGLDLKRADAAVGVLSGVELQRLASQARQANADIIGGKSVTFTWPLVVVVVVALVVLIALL